MQGLIIAFLSVAPNKSGPRDTNMKGTLPYDVSFLSTLSTFIISRELITGTFPDWSRLTTLEQLLLNNNMIEGEFPLFLIQQNPLLGTIQLTGNAFGGRLPSFVRSTSLVDLRLGDNVFTGSIVSEISNLESLSKWGLQTFSLLLRVIYLIVIPY
jgi:hypothetical protein